MIQVLIDVIEVESVYQKKGQPSSNGIISQVTCANIKFEGGSQPVPVAEGVKVPAGWSGKAICRGNYVPWAKVYQGSGSVKGGFVPTLIQAFAPIEKVSHENDLQNFLTAFTAPGNDSSAPKSPTPEGGKGLNQR